MWKHSTNKIRLDEAGGHLRFVESEIPRRERSSQHTLSQGNNEVHDPQPAKEVVHLHTEQVTEKTRKGVKKMHCKFAYM